MLLLVLDALAPLLKKRDTYYLAALGLVTFFLWRTKASLKADEAALAARPKVETRVEVQTQTVRVAGPVRVETKTIYVPGTNTIQYVDRVVTAAPVTTTIGQEKDYDRTVAPACPPPIVSKAPWRYAGILADPTAPTKLVGARGGVTLWNFLDLGIGFRVSPRAEGQGEIGVRF